MSITLSDEEKKKVIEKCELEYGRTITHEFKFRRAKEKAFTVEIEKCTITYINDKCEDEPIEKIEDEAWINLFFENNSNIIKRNSAYNIRENRKARASLEFRLTPTPQFLKAVKKKPENFDDFNNIINDFGQFISTKVILGGRAFYKKSKNKRSELKLAAGGKINKDFDKDKWDKSLKIFEYWDCIKFENSICIFWLLPDIKKGIKPAGEETVHEEPQEVTWYPNFNERQMEESIPKEVSKFLKENNHSIFVTVIDKDKKDDIFSGQIIWTGELGDVPKLLIQIIQEPFHERICKLEIKWKVIQYTFDNSQEQRRYLGIIPMLNNSSKNSLTIGHYFFKRRIKFYTFSYCLKERPSTFNTLIISKYCDKKNKLFKLFDKFNLKPEKQEYIQLYPIENILHLQI